ncbi:MAG: acetyl-CoA carboxylase biotin carboxylase subunit, partial [Alphaproteobacteria bacterium]
HPVTEMITGLDLLHLQLTVAAGLPLPITQDEVEFNGHSIEVRVNAEHPETFLPSPGKIAGFHAPGGLGVRVDSQIYTGYKIPPHYDSLVAKLIVHANDRDACMKRLERCLSEFVIDGIHTSLPLHHKLVRNESVKSGDYTIKWLEENLDNL